MTQLSYAIDIFSASKFIVLFIILGKEKILKQNKESTCPLPI